MVLLRTFDERSVVYHRQGRIGTYAIFWNHEAIQAGATFALDRRRLDLPLATASRRSASCAACPRRRSCSGGAAIPSGWWSPADWNVASICVPIATQVPHAAGLAWGKKLRGEPTVAMAFFGDGATSEGAFHEGVELRRGDGRAGGVRLQQQPVGDLDADRGADARRDARRQGGRLRHSRRARRRARRARRVRGGARGGRARARGRRPDVDRGGALPRGAARDRRRPARLHRRRRASRRSARANASAATRRSCASAACSNDELAAVAARGRGGA